MRSEPYRALPYADPTGEAATARADRSRQRAERADVDAFRAIGDAPHLESRPDARPLTNAHCIAALIAARIGSATPLTELLADAHTPNKEVTWEPENTSQTQTERWERTPETFES